MMITFSRLLIGLTLILMLAAVPSAAVELIIPNLTGAPADNLTVPVLVRGFTNVAGIEIHIDFDMAAMTVDSITSPVLVDATVNAVDGTAHIIWEDFMNPVTLDDDAVLVLIHCTILPQASGNLALTFTNRCELTDDVGDPFTLTLTPGEISITPTDVNGRNGALPLNFDLKQNFPNPFNPATTVAYTVERTTALTFEVYNVSGQLVDRLDLGRKGPGSYSFEFSAANLASGVYTYRLIGDGVSVARQMVVLK